MFRQRRDATLALVNAVVMFLLEPAGVALVAGSAYGLLPFFRMSIATWLDVLEDGCRRVAGAVATLR